MTAEVSFAKTFLASLDSKPIKLQSDYAADLKTLDLVVPYTLPRMSTSMRRPDDADRPLAPGAAPAVTVTLKSLRAPALDMRLPAQPLTTSVLEIKKRVAQHLQLSSADAVRLLYHKKPCADAKSIKDVAGPQTPQTVDFSVMIMGGAAGSGSVLTGDSPSAPDPASTTDQDAVAAKSSESDPAAMQTDAFWNDLEGFLEQRLNDRAAASEALQVFRQAWTKR